MFEYLIIIAGAALAGATVYALAIKALPADAVDVTITDYTREPAGGE